MTGIQYFLGRVNHRAHGNLADYNFHFNLGQQIHLHRNAAVVFRAAFLHAAAQYLRDRHAGNANFLHGDLEHFKAALLGHNDYLGHLHVRGNGLGSSAELHGYRLVGFHRSAGAGNLAGSSHHGRGEHLLHGGKIRIGTGQAVLHAVQPGDFLFGIHPQAHGRLDNQEG